MSIVQRSARIKSAPARVARPGAQEAGPDGTQPGPPGRDAARHSSRGVAAEGASMSTLVLEMRQGDLMVVNGAAIRFRSRTRIELMAKARFLFGKQVMSEETANTPARRIYHALQESYVGPEEQRDRALDAARGLIAEFQGATTSDLARQLLDRALMLAESDDWFAALKHVRIVMRHEAAVLGLDAATGQTARA